MSITRSQIARQLLAEGGAPRKGFQRGNAVDTGDFGTLAANEAANQAARDYFETVTDDANEERMADASARDRRRTILTDITDTIDDNRDRNILSFIQRSSMKPKSAILSTITRERLPEELFIDLYRDDEMNKGLFSEGLAGGRFDMEKTKNLLDKLEDKAGFDRTKSIKDQLTNMTQTEFNTLFPGPQPNVGGDNETLPLRIKKPITEAVKKEEPKDEFDDILKFYGARFASGGTAGDSYGEDIGAAYGTAGITEATSGGDNENEPPTVVGGGGGGETKPPMLSGGRGIDVGALEKRGLSPEQITSIFNEYYGIDTTPTVTGPLGSGLMKAGAITPTVTPTINPTGKVQGTNLDDLRQAAEDVGRAISDPTSPLGKALDFGKAAVAKEKELAERFGIGKADGGVIRQNYGLGSIVKKATRAVKKVAKSPLGKAALIGGLGYLGATKTGFGGNLLKSFKDLSALNKALLIGGTALTLSPFATQEEEEEKLPTAAQSDPEFQNLLAFYGGPRRFAQTGGDIEDAPKEKPSGIMMASNEYNQELLESLFEKYLEMGLSPKDAADKARQEFDQMSKAKESDRMTAQEGGLMNLGGNEMDLRGGGFVPLGAKEKADDVPARLSKNEFVFTADAVRAAGGGSVDRGADIMYKTMKNLENKVA